MNNLNFWLRVIRNILRIIICVLIILYFFGVDLKNVFAIEMWGWAENTDLNRTSAYIVDKDGNLLTNGGQLTLVDPFSFVAFWNLPSTANNYFRIPVGLMKKNYFYRIQLYICSSQKQLEYSSDVLIGNQPSAYSYVSTFPINNRPYVTNETSYGYCQIVNIIASPTINQGNWLNVRYSGVLTGNVFYFGYTFETMGLFDEFVQTLIDNISQTATDNANKIINNQNKNHEDMKDTITDDSGISVKTDEANKIQGLFPPGPVDSLLNIPFVYTSKIVNSFSGSCKPIEIPVLGGKKWIWPCLSDTLYKNIFDSNMMKFIELIPCAFILIVWFKNLYKRVDRATGMNTNSDDEWGVV